MHGFRITLERDDGGAFLVTCPALPEVSTFGEDETAAVAHARDAIEEALAARTRDGREIPPLEDAPPVDELFVFLWGSPPKKRDAPQSAFDETLFHKRGLSDSTIKALVENGIDAPERLFFLDKKTVSGFSGIGKAELTEINQYRERFLPSGRP
jgi:predicted RNase H-like HicB family nuclease